MTLLSLALVISLLFSPISRASDEQTCGFLRFPGHDSPVETCYAIENNLVIVGGDMILGSREEVEVPGDEEETEEELSDWLIAVRFRLGTQYLTGHISTESNGHLWMDGIIPYVTRNLSSRQRAAVTAAIAHYHQRTSVRLVPQTNQSSYVSFEPTTSSASSSHVGRQWGPQVISLSARADVSTVVHEIGHALGLEHEHQRPDRDEYVIVNLNNVHPDNRHNFALLRGTAPHGSYDVTSIMHYSSWAFASGLFGRSLVNRRGIIGNISRTTTLSPGDVETIERLVRLSRGRAT